LVIKSIIMLQINTIFESVLKVLTYIITHLIGYPVILATKMSV
jgi:hypothetical protein